MRKSWVPLGSKFKSRAAYPHFPAVYQENLIRQLAREYEIPRDKLEEFRSALGLARDFYFSERALKETEDYGVADAKSVQRLKNYLENAIAEPRAPELWKRLNIANARVFPAKDQRGFELQKHWWFLAQGVEDLLDIVTESQNVDGRQLQGNRRERSDAKSAALPLVWFWTELRGTDQPSLYDRGGRQTKALRFVLDCLHQLDDTITASVFRDYYERML